MKKTALFILGALLFLFIAAYLILAYFYPLGDISSRRKTMDNPIVNSHYQNWKTFDLDEHISVKIPSGWTITAGERLQILDETGKLIAEGIKGSTGVGDDAKETLSTHYGKELVSFSTYNKKRELPRLFWNRSDCLFRVSEYEDASTSEEILLTLSYLSEYEYCFVFYYPEDLKDEYYDTAEAIAWSMTYSEDRITKPIRKSLGFE